MNQLAPATLITIGMVLVLLNIVTICTGLHPKMESNLQPDLRHAYLVGVYLFQAFLILIGAALIIKGAKGAGST